MTVEALTELLEQEFSLAFEVKDEKALKRSLTLLTRDMVFRDEYRESRDSLNSDVQIIAAKMSEGFRRMDERFEQADRRHNTLTWFIGTGTLFLSTLMSLYHFLG